MRKRIIIGRRAPGITRSAAHAHLRNVHSALVLSPPEDAGALPADYTQNHVFDGVYPTAGAHGIERDFVTEIWPGGAPGSRPSGSTPYYSQVLQPDEENFVDNATVEKLSAEAQPLKAGPQGPFKLFLALTGGDAQAAADAIEGALSSTVNRIVPSPQGASGFVDQIVEFWFAERAAAAAVLEQWPAILAATGADPSASFAVAAEQFDSARLRAGLASRAA